MIEPSLHTDYPDLKRRLPSIVRRPDNESREMVSLLDERINGIPIVECGSRMVDLMSVSDSITVDTSEEGIRVDKGESTLVREEVHDRLLIVSKYLKTKGLRLKVKTAYRSMQEQIAIYWAYVEKLRMNNIALTERELREKAAEFVSPPDIVPPHTTGGAVDVTLETMEGVELYMGQMKHSPRDCAPTFAQVAPLGRDNRSQLISAMTYGELANYRYEWWHYSYGDKAWAYYTRNRHAIYGSL